MKRLLIILAIAYGGMAYGHTAPGAVLTNEVNQCEATNGAQSGGITSCQHLCDLHSGFSANYEFCTALPGGGDTVNNSAPFAGADVYDNMLGDIDESTNSEVDLCDGFGSCDQEINDSGNSTVGPVGNLSGNIGNGTDNFSPEGGSVDFNGADILSGNDLLNGNTIGDNPCTAGNGVFLGGDGGDCVYDDSTNIGGQDSFSPDASMSDSGNASIGTITDGNNTMTTGAITDGANTMTTGAITDGNVTVSGADINCHPHNNSEDASTGDIRCGENVNENAMSNDGSGNSTNENKMAASGNSDNANDVMIDQSDHSTVTSTSVYNEAYRAPMLATQLNVTTSHCINFLGIQMTGADKSGAGGIGLGIPMRDSECRLEKAAILAFQMENYEAGWTAYCNQKSVRAAWVARAKSEDVERRGRKNFAVKQCMQTGVDTQQTLQNIHDELELLRTELVTVEGMPGYDDTAIHNRIKLLEDAAHLPNKSFLLNK